MTVAEFLTRHPQTWDQAINHPFLDGIRDGSLPSDAFERWLTQDYLFVRTSLPAQALLFANAPRQDQSLLLGGMAVLESELTWFETHLQARGLDLAAPRLPTNRAYGDFLLVTSRGPYVVGLVVTTALERTYLEAWSGTRPGTERYREFIDRWTTPEFQTYVDALVQATDRALAASTPELRAEAEDAFLWTARYERDFWQMAYG